VCGICGVVYSSPERLIDTDTLHRMTDIMKHRGPDGHGFHIAPGVGLGVRRLSIIDLRTGDQPISNEDGTITLVCNGEIYNAPELTQRLIAAGHQFRTRSDVEVIIHLYEQYGVHCVNHLRGMFAFGLWDARRRCLMLARDRLGIKPLNYALDREALTFASETKSLLTSGGVDRQADLQALRDVLTTGFILAPKSMFKSIRRLQPGHYILYQDGRLSVTKYWDLRFPTHDQYVHRDPREWSELLRAKLDECVRIHLRSDVPVGAWLSGGVDSSAIVSLMSRLSDRPVPTFSLAFDQPAYDEMRRQRTLRDFQGYNLINQQALGSSQSTALLPKAVWHCEDPVILGASIPRMLLSKLASGSVKVVLTGEGSDEVFGGYPWFRTEKLFQYADRVPQRLRRFAARIPAVKRRWPRACRILSGPDQMSLARYKHTVDSANEAFSLDLFSDTVKEGLRKEEAGPEPDLPDDFDRWHRFAQMQYLEMKTRLPDFITRDLDAASMAYSLETRVPFLDHELVEFCATIPPDLKMSGFTEKYILRQALRDDLPAEIRNRRKRGLTAPIEQWLNLPEHTLGLLAEDRVRESGYFDPISVTRALEQYRSGRRELGKSLIRILGVQIWHDLFVRDRRLSAP